MRVIFMGTPEFAVPVLQRLLESPYQLVAVYTRRDKPAGRGRHPTTSPVKQVALAHNLPVYQPGTLRRPEEVERLRDLRPDVIVVAAYGLILPLDVLALPPHGCLNVHPSLLPRHRGPSPVAGTILAGDGVAGVTLMLMDAGTDTGPILVQREVPISPHDTTGTLTARLAREGADLLVEALPRWLAGEIAPRPQDDAQATVTRTLSKEDGEIDWSRPAGVIDRRVRAFQPWPGSYTFWGHRRLLVLEAEPGEAPSSTEPGRVLRVWPGGTPAPSPLVVQTGRGVLALRRVQVEGRRAVSGEEFLRGQPGILGERLGKF